ncbi:MAG: hypothetical protein M5U12_10040 [Verrucomicrobia bacterium]|nr:hypothetical protein [Verrucomicrobiota bacterium]
MSLMAANWSCRRGFRRWQTGRSRFPAGPLAQFSDEPVAGTFGWVSDHTLEIKVCAYETPFNLRLRLAFEGDRVTLDREANVSFGPTKSGTLVGRAEPRPDSNQPGFLSGKPWLRQSPPNTPADANEGATEGGGTHGPPTQPVALVPPLSRLFAPFAGRTLRLSLVTSTPTRSSTSSHVGF